MKITVHSEFLARTLGVAAGDTVEVADRKGVPLSREWRNRLRDAAIDDCVSIPQNKATRKKSPTDKTTEES